MIVLLRYLISKLHTSLSYWEYWEYPDSGWIRIICGWKSWSERCGLDLYSDRFIGCITHNFVCMVKAENACYSNKQILWRQKSTLFLLIHLLKYRRFLVELLIKRCSAVVFIKSQNSYLIMLLYRRKTYFKAFCTLLKISRNFRTKYSIFCWIAKKNFTRTNQEVPHLGIFYSRRIIFIDAGHQRGTSFNQNVDMKTTIF
jgi:hypothetical protein